MSRTILAATTFGKEIRKRLIDLDLETKDLAKTMGYSPSYISEVLRGTRKAEHVKRKICDAVGLDYDYVMLKISKGA